MKVGILESGVGLEPHLLKFFVNTQHFAKIISASELLEALPLSFLPPNNSLVDGEPRYDCYVLNIRSATVVERTLEVILSKNSEGSLWRPRIILISNLTSWSGKRYHVPIGASLSEFTSRVPSGKEILNYKLENKFHSCASITGMQMCLVSSGLIYGGPGFDLHNLFRSLWEATPDKVNYLFSSSNGKNIVPMIHYVDLVEIVGHMATRSTLISFFFPATDGCSSNLSTIAEQLSLVSKRNVEVMKKEDAINFLLDFDEGKVSSSPCPPRVWNLDLRFSDSARIIDDVHLRYPNGMIDFVVDIWKEYVNACATEPCSFLIAGPPSSLKTSVAKELAAKLQVAYIDPINAMKFIVDTEDSQNTIDRPSSKATDVNHTLDLAEITEPSVALKIELGRVLTVQINGEKKKGKVIDETPVDLKTVNWTPSLVAAIPSDLIRRCAKVKISEDVVCARAGYVLDLWGQIKDLESFYEVTGTFPNMEDPKTRQLIGQQQSFCLDGFDTSPISKSSISPRLPKTSPRNIRGNTEKLPQIIVELQSPDNITIDRVLASLGCEQGGKLSKEHQAVLKDLESKLAQYSDKLVDRVSSNGAAFKTSSLLKMLEEIGYNIRYVNVSHLNGRGDGDTTERNKNSISKVVNEIYEEYSSLYGPLPWLSFVEEQPVPAIEVSSTIEVELKLVDNDLLQSIPLDSGERIFEPMASLCELDNLNDELKQIAIANANNLQNYLVENVLPHVAEALVNITRERIDDPVLYLANFLYHRGVAVQEQETTAAYEKFLSAVQQAEAMEEEAAAQLLALSQQRCS